MIHSHHRLLPFINYFNLPVFFRFTTLKIPYMAKKLFQGFYSFSPYIEVQRGLKQVFD